MALRKSSKGKFESPRIVQAIEQIGTRKRRNPWRKGWKKQLFGVPVLIWNWLAARANTVFYLLLYTLVGAMSLIVALQ